MDINYDVSRRDLLRAGAAGGIVGILGAAGAFATGRAELPPSVECRLGKPLSLRFYPDGELDDSDANPETDMFAQVLVTRLEIAYHHDFCPLPIDAAVYEDNSVQVYFAEPVSNPTDLLYVLQHPGDVRITISGDGNEEHTAFESKNYRRSSLAEEVEGEWRATIPLATEYIPEDPVDPLEDDVEDAEEEPEEDGPSEVELFQQTFDEVAPHTNGTYTIRVYFEDDVIREHGIHEDDSSKFVSEDGDGNILLTDLDKRDAVALLARFRAGPLPAPANVESLCETTENDQRVDPVDDEGEPAEGDESDAADEDVDSGAGDSDDTDDGNADE